MRLRTSRDRSWYRRGILALSVAAGPGLFSLPALAAPAHMPAQATPSGTAGSLRMRPPDPRRGESLDGRAPAPDPQAGRLVLARTVLYVPRIVATAAVVPAIAASDYVERNRLYRRAYLALTSADEKIGVRPVVYYESGFLPVVGLRYFDYRSLGPGSFLGASARTAGPDIVRAHFRMHTAQERVGIEALYWRRNDAVFAGTTGLTLDDLDDLGLAPSRYAFDRGELVVSTRVPLGPLGLYLRGVGDVRDFGNGTSRGSYDPIEDVFCATPTATGCTGGVSEALVPGFDEGMHQGRAEAELRYGARPARLAGGLDSRLYASYSQGFLGDPSSFTTLVGDARMYLGGRDRQLILRALAGDIFNHDDEPVPFDALLMPSGSHGVRGVNTGRLRGRSALLGSLEYRWLLFAYADASLFVDYGGAFGSDFDGLGFDTMFPAVGGAFRMMKLNRQPYWDAEYVGGLQVAWTPDEGVHLLFSAEF